MKEYAYPPNLCRAADMRDGKCRNCGWTSKRHVTHMQLRTQTQTPGESDKTIAERVRADIVTLYGMGYEVTINGNKSVVIRKVSFL